MPVFKTRPVVRVLLGRELIAGEVEEITLELDCRRPLPIDRVTLRLVGEVAWSYSGHYRGHRQSARFMMGEQILVAAPRELSAGRHQLFASFALNPDSPASWEGTCLGIEYRVVVDVTIPWWPNVHREYAVPLIARSRAPVSLERARVWASHPAGPSGKQPYLEVALATTMLRAGDDLRGSAALGNVDNHRYRRLQIQLIAQETLPRQILALPPVEERAICRWSIEIDRVDELAPVPFVLRLPDRLVPGFEIHECRLRWVLVVVADVARGADAEVRLPVIVAPASPSPAARAQAAPLAVGSERMRLIWNSVAQATELEFHDGRLHGRIGEGGTVEIEVRRGQAPRGGPRLVGELRMPSLAVGLARRSERRGASLRAREPVVTDLIAGELEPLLAEPILSEADDEHIVLERDEAGLHFNQLEAFVINLLELAQRVASLPNILPAPASMQAYFPAWEAAASVMAGRLRPADMRIEIVRAHLRVTLGCVFDGNDGALSSTLIELHPGLSLPSRLRLTLRDLDPAPEHPWPLTELVQPPSWAAGPVTLSIDERSVRVILPAPLPDPRFERERIELLFALGRALHGEYDPYR